MDISEAINNFPIVFDVFAFVYGACIGSFLNVCIYRIPNGESIVRPASHCACGKPIKGYHNIPIIGWLMLRGRASCCGRKISIRYPFVETLTALIFFFLWIMNPPAIALSGMVFAFIMIFCTFVDIDTMTLPDFATVGGMFLGFVISMIVPDLHSATIADAPFLASAIASGITSAIGVIVGSGILYWVRLLGEYVFKKEAMGEGDVILIGCIGAFCGWQGAIFAIFGGSLIGAFIMLPLVMLKGLFAKDDSAKVESEDAEEEDPMAIPYGPWLAIGGLAYFMYFNQIVDPYFDNIAKVFFGI